MSPPTDGSVSSYFNWFGLELVQPPETWIQQVVKPTVDYSSLTELFEDQFYQLQFHEFMFLVDRPLNHPDHPEYGPDRSFARGEIDDDAWQATQKSFQYRTVVYNRFNHMLLHRCAGRITSIDTRVEDIHRYIPVVDQMVSLTVVNICRQLTVTARDSEGLIYFFFKHRFLFPRKKPLRFVDKNNADRLVRHSGEDSTVFHKRWLEYFELTIQIYEVLQTPVYMDASMFPLFYTRWTNLDVSLLEELQDFCVMSRRASEFPLQQQFFMQAKRLKKLDYHVVDVKIFTEAASNPGSSGFLPNLKTLNLQAFKASELLPVLDDAMHGFRETLEFVDASLKAHPIDSEPEVCTFTVGGWNLPAIRRIAVNLDLEGTLAYLGAFNQCPLLEMLDIHGNRHDLKRCLQSAGAADTAYELTLAPVWNLPKLQHLILAYGPAALFNYDSFTYMPALRGVIFSFVSSEEVAKHIPRLSTHFYPTTDKTLRGEKGAQEMRCRQTALEEHGWTETWSLPKLKSLYLIGNPSMVFSFDWLKKCPSLETVVLRTFFPRRLPISWKSPNAMWLPVPVENYPAKDASTVYDTEMQPLYESRLLDLNLMGPWVLEADLLKVLTDYVPNLRSMAVDSIGLASSPRASGESLFKAILAADQIQESRGRESQLKEINAKCLLKNSVKHPLGLVSVDEALEGRAVRAGYRVSRLWNQSIISRKDWRALKKSDRFKVKAECPR
ncbi:hypothetical protein BGZ93_002692 [Podila epicladia]|nr:hypothetical protein BGZ92_011665 [Podila epicladia]KAG0097458.1 hypothetical protein BGZ93_002692 [Podila epicladia]